MITKCKAKKKISCKILYLTSINQPRSIMIDCFIVDKGQVAVFQLYSGQEHA
jgi:hypothetical protein